ncbi:Lead, cadmium, zinc and mercury transporting ATPase; Copper-translocating P-type ATPase [hydrothermal vent metagenome]|uniref:Lead, cadmium, zinc and mercury transporting ATPase Copper-translocating P-type ATPase n=1 Tax=hydrothermal vent metagenome TaxID=652676 RepID=A0A3B0TY01_9ZZZZ
MKNQKTEECKYCSVNNRSIHIHPASFDWKKISTVVSGASLFLALIFNWVLGITEAARLLYFLAIFSGGYFVLFGAVRGLTKQRFLNIDFLVVVAAIGAIYINQLAEAAAVVFFFSLAEAFERFGVERSRKALESLIRKSPQTAILKNGESVPVDKVNIGDITLVRPGDIIPLDGVVVEGISSVDEAAITGESIPKDKKVNSIVFAGTLNRQGYLEVKVTKESKDSTFSKIVGLIEKAQKSRAPAQEFIDTFSKYYTPIVVVSAIAIATIPTVFFGAVFTDWLYRALVLLVIACPCALVISTPVSIASSVGGASRRGVLIKGGKHLEALSKIKVVAFDKTKTLTLGEPYISDVVTFNGFKEEEVLADAAGIEKFSSHPLAKSILDFAQERGVTPHIMKKYENIEGKGGRATCMVCNDLEHCVGNLKLIEEGSVSTKEVLEKTEKFEREGKTVVLVSAGDKVMGALVISDKIRDEAFDAIKMLKDSGVDSVMLTGDNKHAAGFVAQKLGIKKVYASLLPDEKLEKINELKKEYGAVVMVGDGVNDAPPLAASTVGIAMGAGGSDVAVETADIALMNNNLLNIPLAINLGKKTVTTIKYNIIASLGVKAIFLVLALFGFAHLEFAIGADSGVAILVILNSLRLFHFETE